MSIQQGLPVNNRLRDRFGGALGSSVAGAPVPTVFTPGVEVTDGTLFASPLLPISVGNLTLVTPLVGRWLNVRGP